MLYRKGSTVFNELHELPDLWQKTLDFMTKEREAGVTWLRSQNFGQVVYVATSELYNIAISAAKVTHLVSGLNSIAVTPSEIMYGRRPPYDARIRTLVVVLSNPSFFTETSWGVERLKQLDPKAQFLSLETEEGKFASLVNYSLVLSELKDAAKMAVVSMSCLLLASFALVGWISGKQILLDELGRLPGICRDHLKGWQVKSQQIFLDKPAHIVFLGSGPYEGIAREGAMLVSKIATVHSESNYFVEYRHGIYGSANQSSMIIGLFSNTFRNVEESIFADLSATRARRIAIADRSSDDLISRSSDILELNSGVSEIARVVLALVAVQFLVFYLSMGRGINPDNPKHLEHARLELKDRPGAK